MRTKVQMPVGIGKCLYQRALQIKDIHKSVKYILLLIFELVGNTVSLLYLVYPSQPSASAFSALWGKMEANSAGKCAECGLVAVPTVF